MTLALDLASTDDSAAASISEVAALLRAGQSLAALLAVVRRW